MKNRKGIFNFSTASGLKLSSAHAHSTRSAYCASATAPNRPGQCSPLPAWPAAGRAPWHGSRWLIGRQTSQGVHHQLPQPTTHSPDMVESPNLQRGRRVTEGRNSPVQSTVPELNYREEVTWAGLGAALGPCGALGPAYGERGGVRWLGTDRAAENRGGVVVMAYRREAAVGAWTKCKEGGVLLYPHGWRKDGTAKMAAHTHGEMGQLSATQRQSMHMRYRPQRGC
jgi:hypothetical protein